MDEQRYIDNLDEKRDRGVFRQMREVASSAGAVVCVGGAEKVCFASNNYIGIANDSRIVQAVKDGLDTWGYGSGSARLIAGHAGPHAQLEERLSRLLGKEAALVLPSGYAANHAVLTGLAGPGDTILLDKLVHASIVDGARASGATVRVWPHRNVDKLQRLLERGGDGQAFIVTDSLFSMDGDMADMKTLVELKKKYNACLVVDEAHALGCFGPTGMGLAEAAGVLDEVDVYVGTCSKAIGCSGGFVAGKRVLIDTIINQARGFIFTTASPAVNSLAVLAAMDIVQAEPERRERLAEKSGFVRDVVTAMGFDVAGSTSQIVPIVIGDAAEAVAMAEALWKRGYWVPAVRPPTVAPGSSRLRISVMSEHTQDQLDGLCSQLKSMKR